MTDNYTISSITEDDIMGFHEAVDYVAKEKRYLDFLAAPPFESTRSFVRENIKNNHAQFVARADGKVVGWCDIIPKRKGTATSHCGILGMGLLPEFRSKGLGGKLIQAAIEKSMQQGLTRTELNVRELNKSAIAFYKKFGFEIEGLKINAAKIDGIYENYYFMALLTEKS
jgi:ribosomal protein S18 acetylase RimI-like enzyme